MRREAKVRLVLLIVCVGVTIYEVPNVKRIWRDADLGRREERRGNASPVEQVLSDEVAATDPEAADILRYCLAGPKDAQLAEWVQKYPDNEFFLAQLAERLTNANCVDPGAALALADRLVTLSPENAHYRYLKGWILLSRPWAPGREEEAVDQFELGNRLPRFYLPCSRYAERVDRLCDRAGFGLLTRSRARPKETGFYFQMAVFVGRPDRPYAAIDADAGGDLIAAAAQAAIRLLDRAQTFGQFESGRALLHVAERVRLKQFELSESQAQQTRFRIGRTIALDDVLQEWYMERFAFAVDIVKAGLPGLMLLFLVPALLAVWLFLLIVNLLRGRAADARVGIKSYIPFVTGLAGFWGMCAVVALLNEKLPARSLAAVGAVLLAVVGWIVLRVLARTWRAEPPRLRATWRWGRLVCALLWGAGVVSIILAYQQMLIAVRVSLAVDLVIALAMWSLACGVLWLVATHRPRLLRLASDGGSRAGRAVQLLLALVFMAGVTCLLDGIPIAPMVCTFVAVLALAILVTHKDEHVAILSDGLRHLFAKHGPIVASRTRMVRMMSGALLLCWAVVLASLHLSAGKWKRVETWLNDPVSLYGPFPDATRETYENAILASKPVGRPHRYNPHAGIPEHVALAAPEDLSAFLAKRRFDGEPVTDRKLLMFLHECGHDARPVILGAMKDPNTLDVLRVKAEWGDHQVKERLEGIFEEKFGELGETYEQLQKKPNGLAMLILRAWWGDQEIRSELEGIFENRFAKLTENADAAENRDRLQLELETLLAVDNALLYLTESASLAPLMRTGHDRYNRLQGLLRHVGMLDLKPSIVPANAPFDLLGSLVRIAGALAFVSEPREAENRFRWLMPALVSNWRRGDRPRRFSPSSFYLALAGVPRARAAALLREYTRQRDLSDPYEDREFLDVLRRVGDRELAEWVLTKVADSPPSRDAYRNVPMHRPVYHHDLAAAKYQEDIAHKHLEAIFPHLGAQSVPVLVEHLGSDSDHLRAFVVWRLTSLGYKWSVAQLRMLRQDECWKVRLSALFVGDREMLDGALTDRSSVVRVVAGAMVESGAHVD